MCRTIHSLFQVVICIVQMFVRVLMTIILMIENVIRMILQTLYNFISFLLQMLSLIPVCFVFMLTARLKCLVCGGGGPCPINRNGTCDCIMSVLACVILFFIFRTTGVLDKILYSLGYAQYVAASVPNTGYVTESSRNDSLQFEDYTMSLPDGSWVTKNKKSPFDQKSRLIQHEQHRIKMQQLGIDAEDTKNQSLWFKVSRDNGEKSTESSDYVTSMTGTELVNTSKATTTTFRTEQINLTTVIYYLA